MNQSEMPLIDPVWVMKTQSGPVRIEVPSDKDIQGECVRVEEPKQIQEKQ